ncbi:MAG: aldehyde ferredoxin oxidoreductase family protein [Desulfitobacterium hafniense]|nr:aldehyde ferredoxin oxidoreductase family protein [Desulfitobacterium hafniense]
MNKKQLNGLTGKTLRVNLSERKCLTEPTSERVFQENIGGRGVGAYMLLKELQPGTDPLGPDNKLIFTTGPLTGTLTPGASRAVVSFKSPLSGTYSYSLCGGHFPVELKFAGYDVLVIEGKSDTPVFLWIDNDKVELRDASKYWGLTSHETEDAIRKDVKDSEIHIACIGPAGEKLVRYSCIQSDYHREFGRGGAGAVMGSKNLKAIAVRGTVSISAADPAALKQCVEEAYKDFAENPKSKIRRGLGTAEMVDSTNKWGYWGTRNFSTGYFEEAQKINADSFKKDYFAGSLSCYGCPIACGKVSRINSGKYAGTAIEGPEFETIGLLGANCGISDPEVIIKATEICDIYGIDTMSAGATVSMAMECFEQGIITKEDTGGIDLSFGNGEALISVLKQIIFREGIGDILAEGSKLAAIKFGAPDLAMQVKGMEFATYEPRGAKGMGLSYAVCTKGGHHMFAPTMGAETTGDGSQRFVNEGKAELVRQTQAQMAIVDSLVLCSSMRFVMSVTDQMNFIKAVTGWNINPEQALEIGQRIVNMERLFNIREGFSKKDDTLPKRILQELMPTGSAKGQKVDLEPMLREYYEIMGWDEEGRPSKEQIEQLGLEEFVID